MKKPQPTLKRQNLSKRLSKSQQPKSKQSSGTKATVGQTKADDPYAFARKTLGELRARDNEKKVQRWKEAGNVVNDPLQVSKVTGIAVNPDWTQEQMAYLLKLHPFVKPLVALRERADKNEKELLAPGRKAMGAIMNEVYDEYFKIEDSSESTLVYNEIRQHAGKVHSDTPNASILIKVIFPNFDSKRVHMYSRTFEYAKQAKVQKGEFLEFLRREGGFEKIRKKAAQIGKEAKLIEHQIAAENEKQNDSQIELMLEFQRTEPFLKLSLTRDQNLRMKPRSTLTNPEQPYKMVVLLAEMDRIDTTVCNVYGTVPLTSNLRKQVIATLSEFRVRDADFAMRFHVWEDARKAENATREKSEAAESVKVVAKCGSANRRKSKASQD